MDRGVVVGKMPLERVDPDPKQPPVRVAGRVMNEMCNHALETQPEECCGLVSGTPNERYAHVHRCRNDMSVRHLEVDYMRAQREAEEAGAEVTAVYHSHVGAGAYLSEMDQEFADAAFFPFPRASHIVLAVWDHKVSGAGIFERDVVSGRFIGALIEVGEE